jgi:hypothetical protein
MVWIPLAPTKALNHTTIESQSRPGPRGLPVRYTADQQEEMPKQLKINLRDGFDFTIECNT